MNPRLIGIEGKLKDQVFPIGLGVTTLGRGAANQIHISDRRVSQQHCRFEWTTSEFFLDDAGSLNGTFVNGQRIQRAQISNGDEIRVGSLALRFLTEDSVEATVVETAEDNISADTVELAPTDSQYLDINLLAAAPNQPRIVRDLCVLLKLTREIGGVTTSDRLQSLLLDRIFEMIPAERGAILLADEQRRRFVSTVGRHRAPSSNAITVSTPVSQQVMEKGTCVLNDRFVCVPLPVAEVPIGVIYVEGGPDDRFDHRHLELLNAVAGMGAVALEHVQYLESLETQNRELSDEIELQHGMIGNSPKMLEVYRMIAKVAPADSTVLILGETGTGKDLAARAIHRASRRANGNFIEVNCPAIPEALFESELFGHVRGAFTGADRDRQGLIEAADDGTLFLDEIGELPFSLQAKLLTVLQTGEVRRIGAIQPKKVDIRLISATNRSLQKEVDAGRFREDLYYRLAGIPIEMPALRERTEDIPALVAHFIRKHQRRIDRQILPTPPDTIRLLQEQNWRGNIRELDRVIEWAMVIGDSNRIRPQDLPPRISAGRPESPQAPEDVSLDQAKDDFERQLILKTLETTNGNLSAAARRLGRAENYLQRRVNVLGIRDRLDRIRRNRLSLENSASDQR